ncbi:MAG: FAD-dependent oxidoreductase [Thermodesulfobacteriota bacterium]
MASGNRLVVIGGNAAGLSAASYVKRRKPEIGALIFEKSPYASYGSCGLPYYIEGVVKDALELIAIPKETLREKRNLDLRVSNDVIGIDIEERKVRVIDTPGKKEGVDFTYDWLVISTGANPIRPAIPGMDLKGVFTLRSLEDGINLGRFLKENSLKNVAIIGGGYIGMEMAEAFSVQGYEVTVMEKLSRVLPNFDAELSEKVEEKLKEKGVTLRLGSELKAIRGDGAVNGVITDDEEIACDLVLMAVGIKPNVALAKEAGVEIGETGAIKINSRMETNIQSIYACGDCAEAYHRILNRNVWIPLGDTANKQGRIAGANIVGEGISFPGIIGSAATKVFEYEVARTGLGETEATTEGFEVETNTIEAGTRAHYYPGKKLIQIKLIAEKGSGKLLGAQAIGEEGVSKRIDVFATAIWNGMTLNEIAWLDLTYVPPVAPVWDPILVAAQVGMKRIGS